MGVAAAPRQRIRAWARPSTATLLSAGLIAVTLVTVFAFTIPNTRWFYGGGDDARTAVLALSPNPIKEGQDAAGRPFLLLAHMLGFLLTPQSFEGWFWEASVFRLLTAVFLALAVLVVRPRARLLAATAAVLCAVNPTDDLRFWATTIGYGLAVALLLLGILLFLWSFRTGSRIVLLLSCVPLAVSLGTYEGGYLPAAAVPLLLLLAPKPRASRLIWCFAWYGTLGVMAWRSAMFALSAGSYQGAVASNITSLAGLTTAALGVLTPTLRYVAGFSLGWGTVGVRWEIVALAAASALAAIWCASRGGPEPKQIRQAVVALGIAGGFVVLGLVVFIPVGGAGRTQFYAAPAQALLWASLVLLLASVVPARARTAMVALLVMLLVGAATASNLAHAESQARSQPQQFNKMVYVFEQIAPLVANALSDVVILYQVEDPRRSPFGVASGAVNQQTKFALGLDGFQANIVDFPKTPSCDAAGCMVFDPNRPARLVPFDRLIVVHIDNAARVRVATEIPAPLLPTGTPAPGYAPERFAGEPKPGPLPYFRLSWWMTPYRP
jgi:flagellar basal body-associated protein FliL